MGDANRKRAQINLVVSSDQKERWEQHLEESEGEFGSLSQLVRRSVEKEIRSEDESESGGVPENITEQLSEIIEGMNRVEGQIHDLDSRLSNVEREVREDPDIRKLSGEVFEVLPTKEQIIEFEKVENPEASPATSGTIEGIATELDEEEYRIEKALDQLQQDTHQVHSMTLNEEIQGWAELREGGDEIRYYKEG